MSTQCPLCTATTSTRDRLLRHLSIHHRDANCQLVLNCWVCRQSFETYDRLVAHRKENHVSIPSHFREENDDTKVFNQQLILDARPKCYLEDNLQFKAAELLFELRDKGNTTQSVIDSMISGTNILFDIALDIVQSKLCQLTQDKQDGSLSLQEICKAIDGFRGNSFFEGLQNETLIETYLEKKGWLVRAKKVVLQEKEVLRKNLKLEKIPVHFGYIVPFLSLLEKILNLPEVLHCIDNPKPVKDGIFTSPLDGHYYRNHPLVKKYPGTLAIGSYVDDVNLSDTASTKPVHARFFYWNLLSLFSELRSNSDSINMVFCAQAEIVKQYGYEAFLEDFIQGLKKLSSDEGVSFIISGERRTFHAILLCSSGDNPASANLAGFKESHFAELLCRQCMGTKPDIYSKFVETDFERRSMESHMQHLKEIEEYNKNPSAWPKGKKTPSVAYGVNSRSIFMNIPNCDVTKIFVQDLMHDTIHGSLKLEIVHLLNHAVNINKSISLPKVNERIQNYAKYFGVNTPSIIETSHITNLNLRQSASETLALAQMLPFALLKNDDLSSGIESVVNKRNLKCYMLRLNLLNLQMASEFSLQDIDYLQTLTKLHHDLFVKCYPQADIPKTHFEIHFGTQILLFGPLRHHWCFRFEGKHAYFKRLCKILHNFTNIFFSLTKRHQIKQAAAMHLRVDGGHGPYLQNGDFCAIPKELKINMLPEQHRPLILQSFTDLPRNGHLNHYSFVVVQNVHYSERDAIVLSFVKGVPILGQIVSIYGYKKKKVFLFSKLVTEKYERSLNAFKVHHVPELGVIPISNLAHSQKVPYIKSLNAHFVIISCRSFLTSFLK